MTADASREPVQNAADVGIHRSETTMIVAFSGFTVIGDIGPVRRRNREVGHIAAHGGVVKVGCPIRKG